MRLLKIMNHKLSEADARGVALLPAIFFWQCHMPKCICSRSPNPKALRILLNSGPARELCFEHNGYWDFLLLLRLLLYRFLILFIVSVFHAWYLNRQARLIIPTLFLQIVVLTTGKIVIPQKVGSLKLEILKHDSLALVDNPAGTKQVDIPIPSRSQINFDCLIRLLTLNVFDFVVWRWSDDVLPVLLLLSFHNTVHNATDEAIGGLDEHCY